MGGDNFNKANSDSKSLTSKLKNMPNTDSESLANALKKAQNDRGRIENRLKTELQAQLEVEAAKYVNTLRLEYKIAEAALKGKTSLRLKEVKAHGSANIHTDAFVKKDATTGLTFTKSWYDFYQHIQDSYSSNEIRIDILVQTDYKLDIRIKWQ